MTITKTVYCERCKRDHEIDITPVPSDHSVFNAMPWLRNAEISVQRTYANSMDAGVAEIVAQEDRIWKEQVEKILAADGVCT